MKTSMREMQRRRAGKPEGTRNPKIISPYQQRNKSRVWKDGERVDPDLVVREADLAALAKMQANRPLKPPPVVIPERRDAGAVAARKTRNGIA